MQITQFLFFIGLLHGMLGVHFAQKRGRHPLVWFFVGLLFGFLGILTIFLLPKVIHTPPAPSTQQSQQPTTHPQKSDLWLKFWYYLDCHHQQQGPYELPDLIKSWESKEISEKSFVWGEGMENWKQLADLPDLMCELDQK